MLRQPLDRLIEPAEFTPATAGVAQARVAVEVLRGVLRQPVPAELDQRFRARAYEMMLRELGTSSEEVRLSRTADDATPAVVGRTGWDRSRRQPPGPSRHDHDRTRRDHRQRARAALRVPLDEPVRPPRHPGAGLVSLWQHDALAAAWLRADNERARRRGRAPAGDRSGRHRRGAHPQRRSGRHCAPDLAATTRVDRRPARRHR